MSLQWKLTSQKTNQRNLILLIIGIIVVGTVIAYSSNSCGIQHIQLINNIASYENTLDPEVCEVIVEKIDLFNEQCKPEIEILDCG